MKIVLFGEDIFSATTLQSLIDSDHNIQLVICPYRENDSNYKNLQKITDKYHIVFIRDHDVNSEKIKNYLIKLKPDLILSVHLKRILKKEIFSQAKYGAINVHPSLLPKYRGLSPHHQAIIHGETTTGVTVHFIEESIDTGDLIIQKYISISENDYIFDFQLKMLTVYKTIVIEAIEMLLDKNFKPIKQKLTGSSYFGALKDKDRKIDINRSKIEVYNLIRAVSLPYEGAFYDAYIIWRATFPDPRAEERLKKHYKTQGIYIDPEGDNIILRLKDGVLLSDDFDIIN